MPIILNGTGTISGLTAGGLPSSSVTTANIADNAVTYAKIGTTEQGQLCKAWVNFDGTGTVAIRASYNVSSITDNGTGDYTVNFTNALADANYSSIVSVSLGGSYNFAMPNSNSSATITAPTTSAMRFAVIYFNGTAWSDPTYAHVAILR
jgi:hypothetical protein